MQCGVLDISKNPPEILALRWQLAPGTTLKSVKKQKLCKNDPRLIGTFRVVRGIPTEKTKYCDIAACGYALADKGRYFNPGDSDEKDYIDIPLGMDGVVSVAGKYVNTYTVEGCDYPNILVAIKKFLDILRDHEGILSRRMGDRAPSEKSESLF